ncbi:MAG: lycopene cyclase domain-containing protein [Bacteroidetes bacterium]|nr:lycopene cyclase domain-containing protein [Bacteroidota bacterium]
MSYLQFHIVFTLPALILMRVIQPRSVFSDTRKANASVLLIAVIAFLYTTPWDNYLVANGIWYYGANRVLGIMWHVPLEEYAFFLIQTLITGMWTFWLLHRPATWFHGESGLSPRLVGAGFFLSMTAMGIWWLQATSTIYMGLIVTWAAPVLALQWGVGGHHLWRMRRLILWACALPSVYLCIADAIAITSGVWVISERTSTGILMGPLPIEEAIFFIVTNLLVVQGVLLGAFHLGHSKLEPLARNEG